MRKVKFVREKIVVVGGKRERTNDHQRVRDPIYTDESTLCGSMSARCSRIGYKGNAQWHLLTELIPRLSLDVAYMR